MTYQEIIEAQSASIAELKREVSELQVKVAQLEFQLNDDVRTAARLHQRALGELYAGTICDGRIPDSLT